jgi:hypothetical protein
MNTLGSQPETASHGITSKPKPNQIQNVGLGSTFSYTVHTFWILITYFISHPKIN